MSVSVFVITLSRSPPNIYQLILSGSWVDYFGKSSSKIHLIHIYRPHTEYGGKVIFSQACVIRFTGGRVHPGCTPSSGCTPLQWIGTHHTGMHTCNHCFETDLRITEKVNLGKTKRNYLGMCECVYMCVCMHHNLHYHLYISIFLLRLGIHNLDFLH